MKRIHYTDIRKTNILESRNTESKGCQKCLNTVGLQKKRNDLRIHYWGGGRFYGYFGVNNTPFYMAQFSFLVQGGPLDTGSSPSVIDDY